MQPARATAWHQVRPCRFFATARGCRNGASCGFAHLDPRRPDEASNTGNAAAAGSSEDASLQQRFYMWRRKIPRELHPLPLGRRLGEFFQEGLHLVSEGGAAVQQEVIEKLAESGGLKRIIGLTDAIQNRSVRSAILEHELCPLLQIITHAEVLSSPVLEKPVSQIYEILYGVHGTRVLSWFSCLLGFFDRVQPQVPEQLLQKHDFLLLASTSLLGILRYNGPAATLDDSIRTFAERLDELHNQMEFGEDRIALHQSQRIMGRIHHYLDVGSAVRSSEGSAMVQGHSLAKFVLERDRPGGRHDNDFQQIADIAIMPTLEEIQSSSAEYLPVTDPATWHVSGIRGLVDRQFRLLREDTVGQLRDTVRAEIERLQNPETAPMQPKREAAKIYNYLNVRVKNMVAIWQRGLTIEVEFDQPNAILDLTKTQRQEWWESHRRLQKEAVVCLIDGSATYVIFCSVDRLLASDIPSDPQAPALSSTEPKNRTSMFLQLIQTTEMVTQWLSSLLSGGDYRSKLTMVEFPGVLLPSFRPTLVALQNMSLNMDLPFPSFLEVDPKRSDQGGLLIPLPAYIDKRNFRYNLKAITRDGEDLWLSPRNDFDIQSLIERSSLDEGQAKAVVDSLCRSLALVQGPPGTGKSYTGVALIRLLLDNAAQGNINIGPIVCVTYTNHAVDQLLEQLLHAGVEQMIRIGGRSTSEALAAVNLREVSKNIQRTKLEKRSFHDLVESTTEEAKAIEELVCRLKQLDSWNSIKQYLQELHPHHYGELLNEGSDGFKIVISRKEDVLRWWLKASDAPNRAGPRDLATLMESSLWDMSKAERDRLHRYWLKDNETRTNRDLCQAIRQFEEARAHLRDLRNSADLRCLQQASVIGLTTTGLAKNLLLLRRLRAKVVVMEEAGEILEAHSLTSLLPSTEHCILIGDHLQLMPQINNYSLARESREGEKYSFNTSLFERLIDHPGDHTNLPFTSLEVQRRMHPEISRLVRSYLYPHLKDAAEVSHYPEVAGVRNRLFWFDHSQHEDNARTNAHALTGTSRTNSFEVEFVAAFVSHLIKQGEYQSGDIAVLTPYLGQLRRLKHRLRDTFEVALSDRDEDALALDAEQDGTEFPVPSFLVRKTSLLKSLRLATIDNFQGEEAKVVVISLVRSNPEARVGFLNTFNRINVLLSRAKHGMFIIGNSETARTAPMMANTIRLLRDSGRIGPRLPLCCPRHTDAEISVADPDDFLRFSPEGGCGLFCSQRLSCGHRCPSKCHSAALHEAVYCMEQCMRVNLKCGHVCPLICGQKCDKQCRQIVRLEEHRRSLPCGHTQNEFVECWQAQDPSLVTCTVLCDRTLPRCGHLLRVPCYQDTTSPSFHCPAECGSQLPCGHRCKRPCMACRIPQPDGSVEEEHGACRQNCGRGYTTCRHFCRAQCHGGSRCEPCEASCENRCSHSYCYKPCNQACTPCAAADCDSSCPHSRCSMPCAAPCDHLPCGIRCGKILSCGHQCPSVCGERCPEAKYCQICGEEEIKARQVDFLNFDMYEEVDLNENPCLFLPCGHFYTVETLDGIMSMETYYETTGNGKYVGLASNSEPFSVDELKLCPECRGSMRGVRRYGRIVRRALLDEATKKFIVWANQTYVSLASRFHEEQARLSEAPHATTPPTASKGLVLVGHAAAQLSAIRKATGGRPYRSLFGLRKEVDSYKTQVSLEEQPFQRVFDLVRAARQQNASSAKENFSFDSTVVQTRGHLQASALLLRCDLLIISHAVDLHQKSPTGPLQRELRLDFTENMNSCKELIEASSATQNPLSEVEGHVFFAQFCALQRQALGNMSVSERLLQRGIAHIAQAWDVHKAHPTTTRAMASEIEMVERQLKGGVFYVPVTNDEMRQVVAAMAAEFSGTGHWYYCENGHPFTVGECGMPMETSTCPQCGAKVGGSHHRPVEGVERARDLEEEFGRITV